jgi:hypothetical protein
MQLTARFTVFDFVACTEGFPYVVADTMTIVAFSAGLCILQTLMVVFFIMVNNRQHHQHQQVLYAVVQTMKMELSCYKHSTMPTNLDVSCLSARILLQSTTPHTRAAWSKSLFPGFHCHIAMDCCQW